jgi:oligoendopeptidase F
VLLNYTAKRRDVLTLAHELGHGLHAYLAIGRGVFEQHTPLTLAETASVFGETLVFRRLLDEAETPESRLSLLAENIEGSIATVFRQVAMNRFEDLAHTARREGGELSVEQIGDLWTQSQEELLGDAVEVTRGYRSWWSYVPHFIGTPGYVYAYSYGQLLALSVYGRYLEEGEAFVPRYLQMLSAGGSRSPEELAAIAGLDLTDPGFWRKGIDLVRRQLEQAEAAAEEVLAQRG